MNQNVNQSTAVSNNASHASLGVEQYTLANGAKLLFNHLPNAPRLAISFFMPGGNLLDEMPGVIDMTDRLVMKGTKNYDQEAFSIAMDSLSLDFDTDTKRDYSTIGATLLEEDLDASLALISDVFYNANFDEFEKEKVRVYGEIQMELDSPKARASNELFKGVFGTTAYATVNAVIQEHLMDMTDVDMLKSHYQKVYHPENLIISAGGNIDAKKVIAALEKAFPKVSSPVAVTPQAKIDELTNLTLTEDKYLAFARDDSSQAHIYKAWHAPTADSSDYPAIAVMNTILGAAGLSSRLFLELRDKHGLAYNVRSSYDTYRHKGMFNMYIGTEPSNVKKCLQGFIEECGKLMDTPVSEKELADAKRNILGRRSIFLETAPQQVAYYGGNVTLGRSLDDVANVPALIESVTSADIQRVSKALFSSPSVISVVGPADAIKQ